MKKSQLILIGLVIITAIASLLILNYSKPMEENHTMFNELNNTEKDYVLYVMSSTAMGKTIDPEEHPSPSRNATLAAIQELENAGIK